MSIIDTLEESTIELNRWFAPVILICGVVGNVLNLILFFHQTLLKQSCSFYFLAASFVNLAMFFVGLLTRILNEGFQIDLIGDQSKAYCKIRNYLVYTLFSISSWILVWVSLDRLFSTSRSVVRRRRVCSHRMASKLIAVTVIGCALIHVHMLVFYDYVVILNPHDQFVLTCTTSSSVYSLFYAFFILIFYSLLPPALMVVFGMMTLKNLRASRRLIIPSLKPVALRTSRVPNQLVKMLSLQIVSLVVFTTPHSCYWLYQAFTISRNSTKTGVTREWEIFTLDCCRLLLYINYSSSFYLQTILSKTFRHEFVKMFHKITRRLRMIQGATNCRNTIIKLENKQKIDTRHRY